MDAVAFRLALTGREADAKAVTLAPNDALSPHVWEFLRNLKVDRESFVLYDATRGRRVDPDWPCEQAGLLPGALVMVGDPQDFPDPLQEYRDVLTRIRTKKEWPITEATGHELLEKREHLAVTMLEHNSVAREAGLPPDDAKVLWEWKPLEERRVEEYAILLKNLARTTTTVPESALRKMIELRTAMAMTPEQHMDMCATLGVDAGLAARLLAGTAPVPRHHEVYVSRLTAAKDDDYSSDTLSELRDMVVKHGITLDVHRKLATQAGIAPDEAESCFEDREGVVGRRFYVRELRGAVARPQSTPAEMAQMKKVRDRYAIRRPEHLRLCKEWGIPEHVAADLWELKAPTRSQITPKTFVVGAVVSLVVALATPPGQSVIAMMWGGFVGIFQAADEYDYMGFHKKTGFDREGYNRVGLNKDGYNRAGYDAQGFDRHGYDHAGYDHQGFNAQGWNRWGFGRDGFNARGFDKDGFDRKGIDVDGYDRAGLKNGFKRNNRDASGFDKEGYNEKGFDRSGFTREGWDADGYDRKGFNKKGFNRKGLDKDGYDWRGYNEAGFDRDGFDKDGWDREGFDKAGYDKQGYDRGSYNHQGLNRQGQRPPPGYKGPPAAQPYTPGGVPAPVTPTAPASPRASRFGPDGFDASGRNKEGFDRDGRDRAGFDRSGFNAQGRDRFGYDHEGFDASGIDRNGRDRAGFDRNGRDANGFDREGRDKDGFDKAGYNAFGFDREGRGHGKDLLPGGLATLQSEAGGWMLRVNGSAYRQGETAPPFGVELELVGGNVVKFRHNGVLYERKINK